MPKMYRAENDPIDSISMDDSKWPQCVIYMMRQYREYLSLQHEVLPLRCVNQ